MFQKYFFKVVTRLEFVGQEPFKILLLSEKQLGQKYLGAHHKNILTKAVWVFQD